MFWLNWLCLAIVWCGMQYCQLARSFIGTCQVCGSMRGESIEGTFCFTPTFPAWLFIAGRHFCIFMALMPFWKGEGVLIVKGLKVKNSIFVNRCHYVLHYMSGDAYQEIKPLSNHTAHSVPDRILKRVQRIAYILARILHLVTLML